MLYRSSDEAERETVAGRDDTSNRDDLRPLGIAKRPRRQPVALADVLRRALDYLAQGLAITDAQNRIRYVNRQYCDIYKMGPAEVRVGEPIRNLFIRQAHNLGVRPEDTQAYVDSCFEQMPVPFSGIRDLPDGRSILIERREIPNGFSVATHEDITDRLDLEKRIRFAAHHDALTQLPNRLMFLETLEKALARVRRGDQIALLLIDLDRFKRVNDANGHAAGDALLREVARRLTQITRETDLVARLGGDEFAVLQIPADTPLAAEKLAIRVIEALSKPYRLGDRFVMIGVSIGIATATAATATDEALMHQADFALYRAKSEGRGTYRFFEEQLDLQMRKRRELEDRMRHAIVTEDFALHYQPIVNLERGRVETLEALLRWTSDGVPISPGEFIPVAEESGLILPLGDWVLRNACIEALNWPDHIAVAVNVSPLQFQTGNIGGAIDAALKASGLAPERLEIEITESALLEASGDVVDCLRSLRDRGISIALDDFGSGYSSLSYLTSFAFNKLKIDRSFVRGLPADRGRMAIFSAVAALCRDINIQMTVEGVETIEQLSIAKAEQCSSVQGFLCAKPTPAERLAAAIAAAERCATGLCA